jgi:hypothetical protein
MKGKGRAQEQTATAKLRLESLDIGVLNAATIETAHSLA